MRLAIFAFTRRGCELAKRIAGAFEAEECRCFTTGKFAGPGFEIYTAPLSDAVGPVFSWADTLVFVGSTGIAVRAVAPWVRDKKTDPAVLTVDEGGNFVISLLSGHIGGANAEARLLAAKIGAQPIVTTATDIRGKFAADEWAAKNGAAISSMKLAKAVAAEILERDVPLACEFPIRGELPGGIVLGDTGKLGICIGCHTGNPFDETLHLIPKVVKLGIGCRRGTQKEAIAAAVDRVLARHGIAPEAVTAVASIDLKAEEPGLLEFCKELGIAPTFYSAEELMAVPGDFPQSEFVKSITGADNVCQRAALLGAERIIIEKTAVDGVTVAAALLKWEAEL